MNSTTQAIATNTGGQGLLSTLGDGLNALSNRFNTDSGSFGSTSYAAPAKPTPLISPTSYPFNATGTPVTSPTHAITTTTKTTPIVPQSQASTPGLITSVAQAQAAGAYDAQNGAGSYNMSNGGQLPVTGSQDHTQTQSYAGDTTVPSQNTNFNIDPTGSNGTVPSSTMGSTNTYNDVLNQRNTYEQQLLQAYNDPNIQAARQAAADANTNLMASQKQARDQNLAILSNGGMTRQQATPFATQADLINSNNVANYGLAANAAANQLGVYTAGQQNQIQGYGSLLSANQQDIQNQLSKVPGYLGTVTSPTGDLYVQTRDPITGKVTTTSAANIFGSNGSSSGSIGQSSVPQILQGSTATTYSGATYVDVSKLTPGMETPSILAAKQAGIPVLGADDVTKIRNIDVTKENLTDMGSVVQNLLGSGVVGRAGSSISNFIGNLTQSNPTVAAFNNYRTVAINTLQALGAGTGGARINASEIATAVGNLPTLYDNVETANQKLSIVNGYLDKWTNELLPNSVSSQTQSGSQSSGTSLFSF